MIDVRLLTEGDRAWALAVEAESWSTPVVARLGELVDPAQLPGFIARLDGQRVGLASYAVRGQECELVTIRSLSEGRGVGRALLDAVHGAAIQAGCSRLWLITTNDNLRALGSTSDGAWRSSRSIATRLPRRVATSSRQSRSTVRKGYRSPTNSN